MVEKPNAKTEDVIKTALDIYRALTI